MRAYVMTTGVVFGLLTIAHIWRVFAEDPQMAKDPFFMLITAIAAALALWAARLLWSAARPTA
jgi:hypothetical protein